VNVIKKALKDHEGPIDIDQEWDELKLNTETYKKVQLVKQERSERRTRL
jgi:hypothetical protein